MNDATPDDPVEQMRQLGNIGTLEPESWSDYVAEFGLAPEHVEPLIRMACDPALLAAPSDSVEGWAPLHAWRALGQLRAEAAIEPLLQAMEDTDHEDLVMELPVILGLIGPAALPHLDRVLNTGSTPAVAAPVATSAIGEIVERHPETLAVGIEILTRALRPHPAAHSMTNGLAVSRLIDMKAVESIDAIREALCGRPGGPHDLRGHPGRGNRDGPANRPHDAKPPRAPDPRLRALR